jgi:hypothetical protein
MTIITLTDPDQATQASVWCINNIGFKHWTMNLPPEAMFGRNVRYEFKFDRKQDAVLFSLKWL